MNLSLGTMFSGPAGSAVEVVMRGKPDRPDWEATLAVWFIDCPGQSPAWRHYLLSIIHLRPIEGVKPAIIRFPHATHEVLVAALDPTKNPRPLKPKSWSLLRPINVMEQVQLDNDDQARQLARDAAWATANGVLPAEPPLAGAIEPWRTALIKTAAHARGEAHAP